MRAPGAKCVGLFHRCFDHAEPEVPAPQVRFMISRAARGFHQAGVVVALPILLIATGLAGHEEWLQRTTQNPGQYHTSFGTPLRLLGLAVTLYAAARVIGRVFDGFISRNRSGASK